MSILSVRAAVGHRLRTSRARFRGCAIVLAYHRVARLERDPQLIAVSPENFAEQISVLARNHETLTCAELFGLMREGKRLPKRAVVVTIDDGYVDNMTTALPILKGHGVPATAFLSSSFIGGEREFWWDELERVLLAAGELPARFELHADGSEVALTLASDRMWTQRDADLRAGWNITQPPPTPRHELFLALYAYVQPLTGVGREQALAQLREAIGVPLAVRPHNRTLTPDEVRALDSSGVFEIGAHTLTHQALSRRTEAEQREEIVGDKAALEAILRHEVRSFCYPHGGRDKFDDISIRLAREAGFDGACTTEYGIVVPWADRFTVPRCHTENIPGDRFRTLLNGWFDAAR